MSHLSQEQKQLDPFYASLLFRSLKCHFTQEKYDYHLYNGKVGGSSVAAKNAFESKKTKYVWAKLAKHADPVGLVVSNLIQDPDTYITEVVNDKGLNTYSKWDVRHASRYYNLEKELKRFDSVSQIFNVGPDDEMPLIYEMYISEEISPETIVLLDSLRPILEMTKDNKHPLVAQHNLKLRKYRSFVDIDRRKAFNIMTRIF